LDSAALAQLMEELLQATSSCVPLAARLLLTWRTLPAAAQLSSEAVARLLQTAVRCDDGSSVRELAKLPAAAQLDTSMMMALLQTAVQMLRTNCAIDLCFLHNSLAQRVSSSDVEQLQQAAAAAGNADPLCAAAAELLQMHLIALSPQ
jgi:hypothetical protein